MNLRSLLLLFFSCLLLALPCSHHPARVMYIARMWLR